jgi:hypothetical protein
MYQLSTMLARVSYCDRSGLEAWNHATEKQRKPSAALHSPCVCPQATSAMCRTLAPTYHLDVGGSLEGRGQCFVAGSMSSPLRRHRHIKKAMIGQSIRYRPARSSPLVETTQHLRHLEFILSFQAAVPSTLSSLPRTTLVWLCRTLKHLALEDF